MEKTKMNYQNGKIYTIRSFQTDDVYYGSTTQPLSKRLSKHKGDYKQWQKNKHHYVTSYELIKFDDCYIELYELYPCNSKTELEKREGQVIRENKNAVNKVIAGRTKKEYYLENIDTVKKCHKQYRENNKESIKEQRSRVCDCECGSQYIHDHKLRHLKSTKHQNYVNNITIKHYKRDEIHECECGSKYTHCKKARHLKSKKHLTYLELIAHNIDTP
jgi:hypothetical protein